MPGLAGEVADGAAQERPVRAHRLPGVGPPGQELPGGFLVGGEVVRPAEKIVVDAGDARPFGLPPSRDCHRRYPASRLEVVRPRRARIARS